MEDNNMNLENEKFRLWKCVLSISDSIETEAKRGQITNKDLLSYLETIEEAFKKDRDPINDFQGFVLFDLCRALRRSLNSIQRKDNVGL